MFFFFQAEDGIRDGHVTGVQTCALPISPSPSVPAPECGARPASSPASAPSSTRPSPSTETSPAVASRSEERRVGKEWRSGGAAEASQETSTERQEVATAESAGTDGGACG